jgi:PAS domain S-box-containing protein
LKNPDGSISKLAFFRDITEQVQAERDLRESEERYHQLFDTISDAIMVFEADSLKFIEVNERTLQMYGYTRDEFLKLTHSDITAEPEKTKHSIQEALIRDLDRIPLRFHKKKDGTIFPVEISSSTFTLKDKTVLCGVVRDISQRFEAEEGLRESEERYRKISALSSDFAASYWIEPDGSLKVEWATEAFLRITGHSPEEIAAGGGIVSITHPEDKEILERRQRDLLTGKPDTSEYRILTKSGEVIWLRDYVRSDWGVPEGRVVRIYGAAQDITERKKAEEELEDIFNLSPDMVGVFTAEGKLLKVNPAWETVLGYSQKELLDLGWAALVHPDDVETTNKVVEKQLKGSTVANFVNRYKCKDGSHKTLEWQASFAIKGIVHATARDITERMQMDEALIESERRLKEAQRIGEIGDWELDIETQQINWSEQVYNLFERDPAQGPPTVEENAAYYYPEDSKRLQDQVDIAIEKGVISDADYRLRMPSGKSVWHRGTIRARKDENGRVVKLYGTVQDITERKHAERELYHRTEDLKLINTINTAVNQGESLPEIIQLLTEETKRVFDAQSTTVYLVSEDQKYLEMQNISLTPVLVKRVEKLIGTRIPDIRISLKEGGLSQIFLLDDGPRLINDSEIIQQWLLEFAQTTHISEKLRGVIRKLIPQIYELIGIRSLITVPLVSAGEPIGLMDFARRAPFTEEDTKRFAFIAGQLTAAITRLQSEQALVDSEYLLRESQKVARLGSYILDIPSGLWVSSPVLDDLFGIDEEFKKDVQGWQGIVAPDDQAMMQDYFAINVLTDHDSFNKEYRIRRINDQQERWVHGIGELEINDDGKPVKMIGTIQDITERKQAEEGLLRQAERLKTLHEIDQAILTAQSTDEIAQSAIVQLKDLINADRISIALFEPDNMVNILSVAPDDEEIKVFSGTRLSLDQVAIRDPLWRGEVYCVDDIEALSDPSPVDLQILKEGVKSYVNVPLMVQEELIGTLNIGADRIGAFHADQMEIAREVADSLAIALQHNRLFEQVREGRDRLQLLSRQLVNVQEVERRYIAQELHDEIGQLLTGLKLTVQMSKDLQSEEGKKELEQADELLDELLIQVRDLSLDLRPSMLDDLGLLPALLWHIERYQGQTGIKVSFEHSDIADRRFIPDLETAAYRIMQEALTNVARHANVKEVKVIVEVAHNTLTLHVSDEGTGFDIPKSTDMPTTLGLIGMRERATMLGGSFEIESEAGEGTKVTTEFPVDGRLERRRGERGK